MRPLLGVLLIGLICPGASISRSQAVPAGKIIEDLGSRLVVSDLDGKNPKVLARIAPSRFLEGTRYPVWAADGSKIAYVRGGNVYAVSFPNGDTTRVAGLPPQAHTPTWTLDGSRLAFDWAGGSVHCGTPSEKRALFVATPGGEVRRLRAMQLPPPRARRSRFFTPVAWDPAGKRLLYVFVDFAGGDCRLNDVAGFGLYHVNVSGGLPTEIQGAASDEAAWSPDGEFIVFAGTGTCDICVSRRNGTGQRTLLRDQKRTGDHYYTPFWPKGGEIYAALRDRVLAIRASDGRVRTVFRSGSRSCVSFCEMGIEAVSADGNRLAVWVFGGKYDGRVLILARNGVILLNRPQLRSNSAVNLG